MAKVVDTSKIFQKAVEAQENGSYDFAIGMFLDILKINPDDIKARMALRNAEKSRFEKEGGGFSKALNAYLAGLPNLAVAALARAFKKYDAAVVQYEKFLLRYPVSGHVLWALARTFEASRKEELAMVTLEFLRQNKPRHVGAVRELAHIYERRNDIQRATQRYQMVLQLRPADIEASKKIHDLAATESIQENWDKGDSFQEKIRDREKAARLESGQKTVRTAEQATDAIALLQKDIEENPDKAPLWAELGDLERRRDDYHAAVAAYTKALQLDPLNQLYTQKLMDVQLAQYDARIEELKGSAAAAPADASLRQQLAALETQRQDFWLGELRRRVDEHPTDTGLRFTLGHLYFQMGKINEATGEFQRVVRDIKYKLHATAMLGKCFAAKGLEELAIEQFEKALLEANLMDEFGKDVVYCLGSLYEKVGNYQAAEDTYKKVFELDIGYRDIAAKMEAVYKRRRDKNPLPKPDQSQ